MESSRPWLRGRFRRRSGAACEGMGSLRQTGPSRNHIGAIWIRLESSRAFLQPSEAASGRLGMLTDAPPPDNSPGNPFLDALAGIPDASNIVMAIRRSRCLHYAHATALPSAIPASLFASYSYPLVFSGAVRREDRCQKQIGAYFCATKYRTYSRKHQKAMIGTRKLLAGPKTFF